MRGPKQLLEFEDHWVTNVGAWFPGERVVFRGKDLFHDLKDLPWMALLIYGITGRIPNEKQVHMFERIWSLCTSYPDPRLWNNRVAALAGTSRSTTALGIAAATAISEGSIYGGRPIIRSIDFLYRTLERIKNGADLEELVRLELKNYKTIYGYGRPVTRKDERIEPVMHLATRLGFADGLYVRLAFDVEKILLHGRWRLHMNIAALVAALAADQGMSQREYYEFVILSFCAGIHACYTDASTKPEGCLFPLRCARIVVQNSKRRGWSLDSPIALYKNGLLM